MILINLHFKVMLAYIFRYMSFINNRSTRGSTFSLLVSFFQRSDRQAPTLLETNQPMELSPTNVSVFLILSEGASSQSPMNEILLSDKLRKKLTRIFNLTLNHKLISAVAAVLEERLKSELYLKRMLTPLLKLQKHWLILTTLLLKSLKILTLIKYIIQPYFNHKKVYNTDSYKFLFYNNFYNISIQ